MQQKPLYVGIDLGTTNSTAATFDGEALTLIRNAQGSTVTPSVVRYDSRGNVTVGAKARRAIESDPRNTLAEFKRVMGTSKRFDVPAIGKELLAEEVAASVLRSLRADVKEQLGFEPTAAVVTVPALFEVPQSAATSRAAQLAGFTRVELLQEPVASALAAGWTSDTKGAWLVYDLGGGTFDASLLETRDGLLRVVGHDGDNFLGGRDFDNALLDHVLATLKQTQGVVIDRADPREAASLAKLKLAVEELRIELTRNARANLMVPGLEDAGGNPFEIDLDVDRATMESVCRHLVDRSIAVCQRLLAAHGRTTADLSQLVLVGGPTVMPFLRERLKAELEASFAPQLDPMTLVAQGAALYAATAGLDARPAQHVRESGERLWLSHPAMTPDLTPHVVGKLVEPRKKLAKVRLKRADGWTSPEAPLDAEGAFVLAVDVLPRRSNEFTIEGLGEHGELVEVTPTRLTIVQGVTIGDPPLSRTIGVALADDKVHVYFERGSPLPARRSFRHRTVDTVVPGAGNFALRIPIVQGELDRAHLCRLVGTLEIGGASIARAIPAGSPIEVTLELDRGGKLAARALVVGTGDVFEDVAHLLGPEARPETLLQTIEAIASRLGEHRRNAFRSNTAAMVGRLTKLDGQLHEARAAANAAQGGDADAAQRAHRLLLDLDAELDGLERDGQWPELESELTNQIIYTTRWVQEYGTANEQKVLDDTVSAARRAQQARQPVELQRQLRLLRTMAFSAAQRAPEFWPAELEHAAARVNESTDMPKAEQLVREGRAAAAAGRTEAVARAVRGLWELMPADAEERRMSYESGVR